MEDHMKTKAGTTTITLSIPTDMRAFFDDLGDNGYNRSFFMLKMAKILKELYKDRSACPGGLLLWGAPNGTSRRNQFGTKT